MDLLFFSIVRQSTLQKLKDENKELQYNFTMAIQQLDFEREKIVLMQRNIEAHKAMNTTFCKIHGVEFPETKTP